MRGWEVAWCLMCIALSSSALRCLRCEDCAPGVGEPIECRTGQNMCMKLESRLRVERTCGTKESCGFGVSERWGRRVWRQVKQLVSDWGKRSQWEVDEDTTAVFCCSTHFCNTATSFYKLHFHLTISMLCVIYSYWTLFY